MPLTLEQLTAIMPNCHHPEYLPFLQAATKEVGFRIAGLFWKLNGLNEIADAMNFKGATKKINGGYNGLANRIQYYERAKKVLVQPPTT